MMGEREYHDLPFVRRASERLTLMASLLRDARNA